MPMDKKNIKKNSKGNVVLWITTIYKRFCYTRMDNFPHNLWNFDQSVVRPWNWWWREDEGGRHWQYGCWLWSQSRWAGHHLQLCRRLVWIGTYGSKCRWHTVQLPLPFPHQGFVCGGCVDYGWVLLSILCGVCQHLVWNTHHNSDYSLNHKHFNYHICTFGWEIVETYISYLNICQTTENFKTIAK